VIYDAVSAADPGDTVYIGQGTWYEFIHLVDPDSNLAIIGSGWDSTFLTADTNGYIFRCANNTLIQDLHIEQPHSTWLYGGLYNSIIVRDCMIENSRRINISSGGDSAIVENCIFNNIGFMSQAVEISNVRKGVIQNCIVNVSGGPGFRISADTSIIRSCILIDIYSYGIAFNLGYADSTLVENVLFYNHTPMTNICTNCMNVINCTHDNTIFNGNHWGAIHLGLEPVNENFRNNSISRTPVAMKFGWVYTPWEITASYFNLWEADSFYNADFPHRITLDTTHIQWTMPMFTAEDDHHLQEFSPLLDASDPAILDVDGSRSDIGCYGGPGGCSYTYLDLAPLIPDSISAYADSGIIILSWRYNQEADFNRYQIYRDTVPGFEPSIFDIISEPDTSYYEDTDILPGTPYYYRLTSVDNQGNVSDYSEEIAVLPTSAWDIIKADLPYEPRITSAYPNPFNSNVVIVYSASNLGPQPPHVTLKVYDIRGRVVRTLVDDRIPQGTYRAIWDGTNDRGEPAASGTYIARVSQWDCPGGDFPVKITLIK